MKKFVVIFVLVFFFIALLGAILFKVLSPGTQPKKQATTTFPTATGISYTSVSNTPDAVAKTCVSWYVQAENVALDDYEKGIESCFTPTFYKSWDSIRDDTGQDPVLYSHTYTPSWLTKQTASIKTQTDTESTVSVTLGNGTTALMVDVQLEKTSNGWRITNVTESK